MIKTIATIFLVLIICIAAVADAPNGLAFLKISPDVRSSAMGEAGVSAGDQRAASYYNPALLELGEQRGLSFAHHTWIMDTKVNYLELHIPGKINFGLNILSTGVDDIEVRSTPSPEPVGYVDSEDLAAGMILSYSVNKSLSFGVNIKYIHEHLYYESTNGFAVDMGTLYKYSDRLNFGASVSNLGEMDEMLNEKPALPMTGRIGLSYLLPFSENNSLLLAGGVNYIRDEEMRGNIGIEWKPVEIIAVRGGYLLNYDERSFTAGFGLKWKNLGLDFAYVPFDSDLGDVKRFGFYLDF